MAIEEIMRRSIKEPIPEIFSAWEAMCSAVDEHLKGNCSRASDLFRQANSPVVWEWLNPAWINVSENVIVERLPGDSQIVPKAERDPDRNIAMRVRTAVLRRDGYRCRYCGIPIVHADIRKIAAELYPSSVSWDTLDPKKQHAGFQCLWLQFDHVKPHSHGGRSNEDNVVISCALCNFGKDRFTLRELDLEDPRLREPVSKDYDGLERLRSKPPPKKPRRCGQTATPAVFESVAARNQTESYFLPGAWISSGYLYTPVIEGKERWFKLEADVTAEPSVRDGVDGCLLTCSRELLTRRGIDARRFLYQD